MHRLTRRLLFALAHTLCLVSVSSAALDINPPRPITHQVTVQLIQTALDDGSSPATVLGDATRRAAIEATVDSIWAQAGIDVRLLPNIVRFNDTFAYQGLSPPSVSRSIQDLGIILTSAQLEGIQHPDPSVINMFFVNIVPGTNLKGPNWVYGVANVGANGIAMFIGANTSVEHASHWLSHEIGHNLGLEHTDPVANLMQGSSRVNSKLTDEQIMAVFQTEARNDQVARIPFGGTGFPQPLPNPIAGDYDRNGVVDAADYALWRKTKNSTTYLSADGNGNGIVDDGDYSLWRANFGDGVAGAATAVGANSLNANVPEPASAMLLASALAWMSLVRRRRL